MPGSGILGDHLANSAARPDAQAQDLCEDLESFERKIQRLLSTSQSYAEQLASLQSAQHAFFDSLTECSREAGGDTDASALAGEAHCKSILAAVS